MSEHSLDRQFTREEVAEVCRTSPATVAYWAHVGYGPKGRRVGRRVLYAESEVRAFLENPAGFVAPEVAAG